MIKILRFYLLLAALFLFGAIGAYAQNCTVNAGQDRIICPGTPFILTGGATGLFATTAVWTQVSGPAVIIGATTIVAGNVFATVTGFVNNVDYKFRLVAKCTDGSPVFDEAIYKASKLTVSTIGANRVECPGSISLIGTPLQAGEIGLWESLTPGGPPIASQVGADATVNLPGGSAGLYTYRYTISDGTCSSSDTFDIRNLGGENVTAVSPYNLSCYTLTTAVQLNGSYGGAGFGQIGTWSFISGPNTPVFNNVNSNNATVSNLIQGTYTLRWTVVGPCKSGSADVIVNVAPATQDVTNAGGGIITYCDGRTSTVLTGPQPLYNGETVLWTQTGGPVSTITNGATNTASISGLVNGQNYDYSYTITNPVTGCSSTGTYRIRYTDPPLITFTNSSPQILPCNASSVIIPYTIQGGNSTQWALISAPAGSQIETDNPLNTYRNAGANSQTILGLNQIGTFIIRFKRTSIENSSGGCYDYYTDMIISVSKKPYTAVAGTPQLLACGVLTATLAGNNAQVGDFGFGQWSQVSGPNTATIASKFNNNTGISNLASGAYRFRWIVSGGDGNCVNTQDDAIVIVASLPTIVNAGSTINACFGTPIQLNGNVPLLNEVGTWTVVSESPAAPTSTILFSNINDPKAIATGFLANKIYTLKWTISNACGTINDNVTINTNTTNGPEQAIAGADQCLAPSATTFNLIGNAAGTGETGTWTLLPGAPSVPTFTANNPTTTVSSPLAVGTYKFEWKIERGGCTPTRDTVAITISPATTIASITGAPSQNVCATAPINTFVLNLLGNAPGTNETGTWTQVEGPGGAVINNPNSYNTANVTDLIAARYKFRYTISNSACASSFAEITYNIGEPPSLATAGDDQTLCDATATALTATVPSIGAGFWTVISGPSTPSFADINSATTNVSNLKLGIYILKWTVNNGSFCASTTDNVSITISQSAKAGADQALCNTTTTVLKGNDGSTGTWTLTSGPVGSVITANSSNTAIVTNLTDGTYVFKYTITAGGCGTLTDEVTVNVSAPPLPADAGPDFDLCTSILPNSVTVGAAAAHPVTETLLWTIVAAPSGSVATLATPAATTTLVDNLTVPGVYILNFSVSKDNCSGAQSNNDIMRITVYAPPTTALAMPAQTAACKDGVVLTGTTPIIGLGTWTYISGGTTIPVITAINSPTTTVTNLAVSASPYIFRWTIANGPICVVSSQNVSVTVVDVSPSIAAAGNDASVCTAAIGGTGSHVLTGTAAVGGTGTWSLVGLAPTVPSFADVNDANTTVSNLKKGTYTFKWVITNTSSCTTEDEVVITVFDPPSIADAGPATAAYCLFSPVQLNAVVPTSGIGTWTTFSKPIGSVEPVFSNANAANTTVGGIEAGAYTFRWTTSNGPCITYQDDINVTIEDCQIAIAKSSTTPVPTTPSGNYNVTFTFKVKNTGTTALTNVQVEDQLNITFPSPKTFSVTSVNTSAPLILIPNPAFNGVGDQNMLLAGSTLAIGDEQTITVIVKVKLN